MDIPVKLEPEEIGPYLEYMENRLNRLKDDPERVTSSVKLSPDENKLRFIYKSYHTTTGNFYTKNELFAIPVDDEYTAVLKSLGDYDWVHVVGSLVRRITMDYTNERV